MAFQKLQNMSVTSTIETAQSTVRMSVDMLGLDDSVRFGAIYANAMNV